MIFIRESASTLIRNCLVTLNSQLPFLIFKFHNNFILLFQSSMLTTWDILEEGFGFMLAFGDISWVPILYSLQARYLVDHRVELSWITSTAIVALFGMWKTSRDVIHPCQNVL